MTVHINIGSNIGNRTGYISHAVAAISELAESLGGKIAVSRPFESEAWGYESGNRFVNAGVALELNGTATTGSMLALLKHLKDIQNSICSDPHRNSDGSYRDRAIDIDIIAADGLVADTDELTLPHPRMHMREFVLVPLAELAPGWTHPLSGLTASRMLWLLRVGLSDIESASALSQARKIYESSFPPSEQRPWSDIENPEDTAGPVLKGILTPEHEVAAMVSYWNFDGFIYIEHLATDERLRGHGLGSIVLRRLHDEYPHKAIVLEVEPPVADNPMTIRRVEFYRRNGFTLLNHHYVQPPYGPGLPSVELKLMTTAPEIDPITVENTLHRKVYKAI